MNKKILLTGASGFVGKRFLLESKYKMNVTAFSVTNEMPSPFLLESINTVLHMGGLAHQLVKTDPEKYFLANFEKTRQLVDISKKAGVKHFIFVSTIKVFGELVDELLTEKSECLAHKDPYGESKLRAELYLKEQSKKNFKISIIRSPLIYGPNVKGNLAKLLKLCDSNFPLPFKNIGNRRTMFYLDNFIALLDHIIDIEAEGLFLAGDVRPISTEELVVSIRKYLGKRTNLFSIPMIIRKSIQKLNPDLGNRLFSSLEMDVSESYKKLNFVPPFQIQDGIKSMVDSYLIKK